MSKYQNLNDLHNKAKVTEVQNFRSDPKSDFAQVANFPIEVKKRLDFSKEYNQILPMLGVEQISFKINSSLSLPDRAIADLIVYKQKLEDIQSASLQARTEAKTSLEHGNNLLQPTRSAPKATFNPKFDIT